LSKSDLLLKLFAEICDEPLKSQVNVRFPERNGAKDSLTKLQREAALRVEVLEVDRLAEELAA